MIPESSGTSAIVADLTGLLSAGAAELYTRALAAPVPRAQLRVDDPVVAELVAHGLVRVLSASGELYALPPEAALSRALHAATIRWLGGAPDFDGALDAIDGLATARVSPPPLRGDGLLARDHAEIESLASATVSSWWVLQPYPEGASESALAEPSTWHRRPESAREHLSLRTVYDSRLLRFPGFYESVRDEIDRGAEVRFAEWSMPTLLVISDERAAFYCPRRATSGVLTEQAGHVGLLCLAFDGAFDRAVPLRQESDLTDTHHRIHTLVGLGHSTSAIASIIGVNERTVRRRINELMDHYGVTSRNTLAAIAASNAER